VQYIYSMAQCIKCSAVLCSTVQYSLFSRHRDTHLLNLIIALIYSISIIALIYSISIIAPILSISSICLHHDSSSCDTQIPPPTYLLLYAFSPSTTYAGRKVEALRRCTFRELPPTLIIHLKRFEFNLETMDRKKVQWEGGVMSAFCTLSLYVCRETSTNCALTAFPRSCHLDPSCFYLISHRYTITLTLIPSLISASLINPSIYYLHLPSPPPPLSLPPRSPPPPPPPPPPIR
jgi:hypothetical protein